MEVDIESKTVWSFHGGHGGHGGEGEARQKVIQFVKEKIEAKVPFQDQDFEPYKVRALETMSSSWIRLKELYPEGIS